MITKRRRWRGHAVLLAAGASAAEVGAFQEVTALLVGQSERDAWAKRSSFRVVTRQDVEARRADAASASASAVASPLTAGDDASTASACASDSTSCSDRAMVEAFCRLAEEDRQSFDAFVAASPQVSDAAPEDMNKSPSAMPTAPTGTSLDHIRVFLLIDFPSTIGQAEAFLASNSPALALTPLDGVVLVADGSGQLRLRRKSLASAGERQRSLSRSQRVLQEQPIPADALLPTSTPSLFQTAGPFVRDLHDASMRGGVEWSDLVFEDVQCCVANGESKQPAEMVQEIIAVVEKIAAEKAAFCEWLSSVRFSRLPNLDDASLVQSAYARVLECVYDPAIRVSSVVFAMREAVATTSGDTATSVHNDTGMCDLLFVDFGDDAALQTAMAMAYYKHHEDQASQHKSPICICGHRIDQIDKEMWRMISMPGVGESGRAHFPPPPADTMQAAAERALHDTEMSTLSSLDISHVRFVQQILRFESMLGSSWKTCLRKREYVEVLDRDVYPQHLASLLQNDATLFKEYDDTTDSLLLATLSATAPGRFRTTSWTARDHMRYRPSFADWKRDLSIPVETSTPRTARATTEACVPLSSNELAQVAQKCFAIYPCDQAIVRLVQTPRGSAWLSASLNDNRFGFRPANAEKRGRCAMQFYANFADGSQVHVFEGLGVPRKPERLASVVVSYTLANGLIITADSTGAVTQRYATQRTTDSSHESYRVHYGAGSVVSQRASGARVIMVSNGATGIRSEAQVDFDSKGIQRRVRERAIDPETSAIVEFLGNGAVVETHTDGSRATRHPDGTCVYSSTTRSHVLVTSSGFADVCVDVPFDQAARRHAQGKRVAAARGGMQTRCVVHAPDGTEIALQYSTRVVAEVNGRVVLSKLHGPTIVAKDSGRVEYHPNSTNDIRHDDVDDRNVVQENGVYAFDCRDGVFSLCDDEQNEFRMELGDGRGVPTCSVSLAGALSSEDSTVVKAVVNEPIEPHLFVLHGDGSASAVLRPRDVRQFLATPGLSEMPPGLDGASFGPSGRLRTFVMDLGAAMDTRWAPWFGSTSLSHELERLRRPVATATKFLERVQPDLLHKSAGTRTQLMAVRRLRQINPLDIAIPQAQEIVSRWQEWQRTRELREEQFRDASPRDSAELADEEVMQKRILVAFKAARARKKAERQKLRQKQKAEYNAAVRENAMETVPEVVSSRAVPGDQDLEHDSDEDDLDDFGTDESETESDPTEEPEADTLDSLMQTAFRDADCDGTGSLSIMQARCALVQTLGIGVTLAEIKSHLHAMNQADPSMVSFVIFEELVRRCQQEQADAASSPSSSPAAPFAAIPARGLAGAPALHLPIPVAAGSGAEAVRSSRMAPH